MKGIVFVEFLEMLDETMSVSMAESLLDEADLPSGGAYTSVGTYDFQEMVTLVTLLSEKTGVPAADLQNVFGQYLFKQFIVKYPAMFKPEDNTFSLLARLNDTIHVDVVKLYPDAEVPHFSHNWLEDGNMEVIYRSTRPFADVAHGMILGCTKHFGDKITIDRTNISPAPKTHTIFKLMK